MKREPFFAIRRGSTRITFLVGSIAIKLPRDWRWIGQARDRAEFHWHGWLSGLVGNVTEAATWSVTRAPFLARTYLSLGLVNVQERVEGRRLSDGEIRRRVLGPLPDEARALATSVDEHCILDAGWVETASGQIRLFDYGDRYGNGRPVSELLGAYADEIAAACGHAPPPS